MNLPLRLLGCSLRVSLVGVVYLRIVRCVFRCVNVALFQFVRNILAVCKQP